ncbi:SAM-dependent methyltransferase [Streptomyces sp. TP-A0874]|uniref:SAM-dependent methyltransferase n=1 Tax=Streptomyces sp. TP-A0874 TaxID=549819 RepID=UPI000853E63C|nr:class I SAM-dependent methyltransferase [Streptomyces sp. TP-A0874]
MERRQISALAHADHPVAAPLSDGSVARLLERALPAEGRVLDLGCAEATWLSRALRQRPALRADGVDIDAATVAQARLRLADEGLDDRITLHAQDAGEFPADGGYDLVLCVGAAHAFGGLLPTLRAVRRHLAPGGAALVGDGFWERDPDQRCLDAGFRSDDYTDLATTVETITADGWTPTYGHISTIEEWDDYEWSWTGSLSRWALEHDCSPEGATALEAAAEHRTAWLRGYRGTLGFLTVLLRATPGS